MNTANSTPPATAANPSASYARDGFLIHESGNIHPTRHALAAAARDSGVPWKTPRSGRGLSRVVSVKQTP